MVGDAFIGFLIIQQDDNGNPTRIANGVTSWTYQAKNAAGAYPQWVGLIDPAKVQKSGITIGNARAIGMAAQVTVYNPDNPNDPPGVEYFNWCVEQVVVV